MTQPRYAGFSLARNNPGGLSGEKAKDERFEESNGPMTIWKTEPESARPIVHA